MKLLIGVFLSCVSWFSYAQDMNIVLVGDGFTKNNQPAATIYYCAPNETDCIQYTFNKLSLQRLLDGKQVSNKMRNNQDIEATADFSGQQFVISNKHSSLFSAKISEHDEAIKKLTFRYNLMLTSTDGTQQLVLDNRYLSVDGEHYKTLLNILNY